jgi:DASH complex subunit DAD3
MASETPDAHLSASQASNADLDNETLSPLEQEVLDEYARLLGNLNNVRLPHASYHITTHIRQKLV